MPPGAADGDAGTSGPQDEKKAQQGSTDVDMQDVGQAASAQQQQGQEQGAAVHGPEAGPSNASTNDGAQAEGGQGRQQQETGGQAERAKSEDVGKPSEEAAAPKRVTRNSSGRGAALTPAKEQADQAASGKGGGRGGGKAGGKGGATAESKGADQSDDKGEGTGTGKMNSRANKRVREDVHASEQEDEGVTDGGEAEQQQAKGASGKARSRGRARPRGGGSAGRGASKAGGGDKGDEEADEAEPAAAATASKPSRGRRDRGGGAKDGAPAGGSPGAAAQQDKGGAKRAGGRGGAPGKGDAGKAAPGNKPPIINPQSDEYKALDLAGKQAAFQAAAKVFSSAMRAAADAGQVLNGHLQAMRREPFWGEDGQEKEFFNALQDFAKQKLDLTVKPAIETAWELRWVWAFIMKNRTMFDTPPTAEAAKPIATAAQQRNKEATALAQGQGADAGAAKVPEQGKPGPVPTPGTKVEAEGKVVLPARQRQENTPGASPQPSAAAAAAAAAAASTPGPSEPAAAAAEAGAAVPLVSFRSTGEALRDRTVAALHQALSSAWAVDAADAAADIERHVYEAHAERSGAGSGSGSVGPAYMRRAFLIWSLLAPDSEAYCSQVQEAVLDGLLSGERLARMDLGDQQSPAP